jgi:hypothetical protein
MNTFGSVSDPLGQIKIISSPIKVTDGTINSKIVSQQHLSKDVCQLINLMIFLSFPSHI